MSDEPEAEKVADDEDVAADEDGTAWVECDAHILMLAGGMQKFMDANHAEAARIHRKTAEIELADATTHKWHVYGKANSPGSVASIGKK